MEADQVLRVGIWISGSYEGWQFFYAKMRKDGRITVPKLMLSLFEDEKTSLEGYALEVMLEPA